MQKISTEYNPFTDAMETWYWDAVNEKMVIKNTYKVGDILEDNKRRTNHTIDARYGNGMMHHVAEIPNAFIMKFKTEHGVDVFDSSPESQKKLRKILEMPEYRFLKTTVKKLYRPVSKKKKEAVNG